MNPFAKQIANKLALGQPRQRSVFALGRGSLLLLVLLFCEALPAIAAGYYNLSAFWRNRKETWTSLPSNSVAVERYDHTAVWTGTHMIVWGGHDLIPNIGSARKYDPITDTWTEVTNFYRYDNCSAADVIPYRYGHSAVWTGTRMLIWGGNSACGNTLNSGASYDPVGDSWTIISTGRAPSPRLFHSAVWTSGLTTNVMIVWGGATTPSGLTLPTGARYDPSTNSWAPMTTSSAPSKRFAHAAVWAGGTTSYMVVWGGATTSTPTGFLNTGGRYNPLTNTWLPTSTTRAPARRRHPAAVWTSGLTTNVAILFGGTNGTSYFNNGGRYNPITNTWVATTTTNAPVGRYRATGIWDTVNKRMIAWGGANASTTFNTGGVYNETTNAWSATTVTNAPAPRYIHTAVWADNLTTPAMIIWGGTFFETMNTGGRYYPSDNTWAATTFAVTNAPPKPRFEHSAVWTNSKMIVWGGYSGSGLTNTGMLYDPATDSWTPTTLTGAPAPRTRQTLVWTGTGAIVWGGDGAGNPPNSTTISPFNTGGYYDPVLDTWTATTTTNAPGPRDRHAAVWAGSITPSVMVVFGGQSTAAGAGALNTGGRFDPATNTWVATTTTGAPEPRAQHAAVWAGSHTTPSMVIWGGTRTWTSGTSRLNTGGWYSPTDNTWTSMTTTGAPSTRRLPGLVWASPYVMVWGGEGASGAVVATGGRYNPSTNSWVATTTTSAPSARTEHSVIWTGKELVVWGGISNPASYQYFNSGGRYDPTNNTWTTLPTSPLWSRSSHTAVWTGRRMIVWGGWENTSGIYDTGAVYTPPY